MKMTKKIGTKTNFKKWREYDCMKPKAKAPTRNAMEKGLPSYTKWTLLILKDFTYLS